MLQPVEDLPDNVQPTGYGKKADLAVLDYVVRGYNWCIENNKNPKSHENKNSVMFPPESLNNEDMDELENFLRNHPKLNSHGISGAMFYLSINLILWTLKNGEDAFLQKIKGE